jgi:hypothetical protein
MGGLILDNQLKRGSYRSLTESEIQKLTEKK